MSITFSASIQARAPKQIKTAPTEIEQKADPQPRALRHRPTIAQRLEPPPPFLTERFQLGRSGLWRVPVSTSDRALVYTECAMYLAIGEVVLEFVGNVVFELLSVLLPHQPKSTFRGVSLLLLSLGLAALGLWVSAEVILERPGWWWTPIAFAVWALCVITLLGSLQAFGLAPSRNRSDQN